MTPIQQAALRDTLLIAETLDKRPRPLCRDCADEDGTCPTTGMPCDTKAVFANARAALASLEAAKQEPLTGWQPISTAPKDGTHILLANKAGVSEGGWLSDIDHGAEWEGQIGMAGWWRADGTDWPPTHWMPLPAAPDAAAPSPGSGT